MDVKKGLVALLVLVAAGIAIWLSRDDATPGVPTGRDGGGHQAAAAQRAAANVAEDHPTQDQPAVAPVEEREAVAAPAPELATLRGRCVDELGAPLAGCELRLRGSWLNRERQDAWRRLHSEEPEWQDQGPVATAADGRFEFTFRSPPFRVSLYIRADGRAGAVGHWNEPAAGAVLDVGDLVLKPGVEVAGRIVDEQGVPQAKLSLYLQTDAPEGAAQERIEPVWYTGATSASDGSFRTRGVPPGVYRVSLSGRGARLREPERVTLEVERATEFVTVVAAVPTDADAITGRVVDEVGGPVEDVRVVVQSGEFESYADSRADGTFRVLRRDGDEALDGTIALETSAHDAVDPEPRAVAWGARDLELRVRRGGVLTVAVTDPQAAPVTHYSVRLVGSRSRWRDGRVRTRGPHEGGVATIDGLATGEWLLIVEFAEDVGLATHFESFEHAGGDRRIDVRGLSLRRVPVRVVTRAGQPLAGSTVQLCETFGKPLSPHRYVVDWTSWLRGSERDKAAELAVATTGADGRAVLSAPIGRDLGLRIQGPLHMPKNLVPARFDDDSEFVVTVDVGARLEGRVVPAGAVPKLRAIAGSLIDRPLRIGLRTSEGVRFPKPQSDGPEFDVDDDGSFSVGGLPAGSWRASLRGWVGSKGSASSYDYCGVAVTLREGEVSTVEFDVSAELPGTVVATVQLDGRPYVDGLVTLLRGQQMMNLTTDAEGGLRQDVLAGDYRAALQHRVSQNEVAWITCDTTFRVEPGETARPTIVARSGSLRLRVLRQDGGAVAGVKLRFTAEEGRGGISPLWLDVTDDEGRTSFVHCPARGVIHALPKELATREGMAAFYERARARGERASLDGQWIDLGEVVVLGGRESEATLRLPASSGY